jgi:hypothetical protein
MNSFQDLNYRSETGIRYNDPRSYSITFSNNSNQTVTVNEGDTFNAPVGCNITYVQAANVDIQYTVNVASAPGTVASWEGLPEFLSISQPSTGVYRVNGMRTLQDWNQVKSPTITLPTDFANNFTYTSTINDQVGNTRTWSTAVTVVNQLELSTLSPPFFTYALNTQKSIGNIAPLITDAENPGTGTYVMTIALSYSGNLTVSGTGGTVSGGLDSPLTIIGTRGEVNARLTTLVFTPTPNTNRDITITYSMTNTTGLTTVATQYCYFEYTASYTNNLLLPFHVASSNQNLRGSITVVGRAAPSNIANVVISENMPTVNNWTYSIDGVNAIVRPSQPTANAAIAPINGVPAYTANITGTTALGFASSLNNIPITAMTDAVSAIGRSAISDNASFPALGNQQIGSYRYKNFFLAFRHLTTNHPSFPLTTIELISLLGPSTQLRGTANSGYQLNGYGLNPQNPAQWPDQAPPWNGGPNGLQPIVVGGTQVGLIHCAYFPGLTNTFGWNSDGSLRSGWTLICRSNTNANTPVTVNGLTQTLAPAMDQSGDLGFNFGQPGLAKIHNFTLSFRMSTASTENGNPSPIQCRVMVTKPQMPSVLIQSTPVTEWQMEYGLSDIIQVN